ncbi:hypothetical protein [Azorhizobium sp. AG788]|uniref:hypothetical protein n=1 Tax=Azorhizobium sp. AG788 TaxID=2183897 RepID=UPI0031389FC2
MSLRREWPGNTPTSGIEAIAGAESESPVRTTVDREDKMTLEVKTPQALAPPLCIWLDGHRHVVRSLGDAIDLLNRGTGHPLARYSELLVHQLETASTAELQARAWQAFQTWIEALRATAMIGTRCAA